MIKHIDILRNSDLNDLIEDLLNEVRAFTGCSEFEDDLTIMALRRIAE